MEIAASVFMSECCTVGMVLTTGLSDCVTVWG